MQTLIPLLIHYRYVILFPIAAFEGPIVSFVVGFLVSLGYFDPVISYFILVMGDIVPDSIYYFIGRFGHKRDMVKRYGGKVGITEERWNAIRHLWHTHGFKTMFISKLAYGLSTAFLVAAGVAGLSIRRFYEYALPVTFAQYAILMTLGYYFGSSYAAISAYLEGAQIFIALGAVLFFVLYFYFMISMRKWFIKGDKK